MWKRILDILTLTRYKLMKTYVWETTIRNSDKRGRIYIHCFESKNGKRKIEVDTSISGQDDVMYLVRQWPLYHEKIYPWLRNDVEPDIPTYRERFPVVIKDNTTESKQGAGT